MHWHTETTVGDLGTKTFMMDLTPADSPDSQPDNAVVDAAYAAAQDLATALGVDAAAFVTLDRVRDPETSAQSISVTITVP